MLRNTLTLIFISVIFFTGLQAQTMAGLRVLSGTSSLTSSQEALPEAIGKHTNVATTTFGLVLERSLGRTFGLRTGVRMTQRGTTLQHGTVAKLLGATVHYDYEAQVRMNYIEMPLALRLELPLARQVHLYGWGGVTAGYATNGSVRSRSATGLDRQLITTKIDMGSYAFPRFHLGYSGGLSLALDLGATMQFRFEAEYNRSTKEEAMISPESGRHGYQSLHFGAGLAFRL